MGDRLFHKHLQKKLYCEAQELVDTHRQLGHQLVIVSSATRYQIEPVAEALGIEHILCTELEVRTVNSPAWSRASPAGLKAS